VNLWLTFEVRVSMENEEKLMNFSCFLLILEFIFAPPGVDVILHRKMFDNGTTSVVEVISGHKNKFPEN
jgi:hypothetical protein